jgi:hypothetical protein
MLQTLPRDKILLETDCPYLGPDRERHNEPENVSQTLRYAAELWSASEADVLGQISHNYTPPDILTLHDALPICSSCPMRRPKSSVRHTDDTMRSSVAAP